MDCSSMRFSYRHRSAMPLESSYRAKDDCASKGLMQVSNFVTSLGRYEVLV